MPARSGNWPLVGHPSDPVAGDPDQLHDLTTYYAKIAETIKSEAAVLQRIGSGDTTELKGQSADAIRSRSKDVAASLTQTSGRYDAVARALTVYGPALDTARTETARALQEAEAADGARGSSAAMPDPGANRPTDAPPLTDAETAQVHARTSAMSEAADSSAQARRRMDAAIGALNAAGRSAAGVIRGAWNDGLVDTWQYKLREGFIKFLKILVKVLMWIGVALAVLAFFIPGLGAAALAGAIVAVAAVVATGALAAMGEGSWLDFIIAVVGVVLIGVGVVVAKVVQTAHVAGLARGTSAAKKGKFTTDGPIAKRITAYNAANRQEVNKLWLNAAMGRISGAGLQRSLKVLDKQSTSIPRTIRKNGDTKIITGSAIKPQLVRQRQGESGRTLGRRQEWRQEVARRPIPFYGPRRRLQEAAVDAPSGIRSGAEGGALVVLRERREGRRQLRPQRYEVVDLTDRIRHRHQPGGHVARIRRREDRPDYSQAVPRGESTGRRSVRRSGRRSRRGQEGRMSDLKALTWSLDVEPFEWLTVPAQPDDLAQWRRDVTTIFELLSEADAELADELPLSDGTLDIEFALDTLLEFSAALGDDLLLVACLGLAGNWPLPVIVDVSATADDPGDMLDAAGARGGLPVSAPTVDDVAEGDGIRVTRLDLDDDGAVWAQVSCARRRDGVDVVLTWRTSHLELVPRFAPLLEQLLARVIIETDA
jgi:hypothetical protein